MATVKQKLAFKKVIKGKSISGAMREVGYSLNTAKVTTKLTKSLGWQELVDKYISEEALMKVHKEGLKATKRQGVGGMVLNTEEGKFGHTEIEVPDYAVRHKYLETGYKIRGKLKEHEEKPNNIFFIGNITLEQRKRLAAEVLSAPENSAGQTDSVPDSDES